MRVWVWDKEVARSLEFIRHRGRLATRVALSISASLAHSCTFCLHPFRFLYCNECKRERWLEAAAAIPFCSPYYSSSIFPRSKYFPVHFPWLTTFRYPFITLEPREQTITPPRPGVLQVFSSLYSFVFYAHFRLFLAFWPSGRRCDFSVKNFTCTTYYVSCWDSETLGG